jgi:hypothetical protein
MRDPNRSAEYDKRQRRKHAKNIREGKRRCYFQMKLDDARWQDYIASQSANRKRRCEIDPMIAAKLSAVATLAQSMGVSASQIPNELIEAKLAQLLVRRASKNAK